MVLGLRGLINLDEGLRYSLVPGKAKSDKYFERRGSNVQYHEVKINIEFRPIELLWVDDSGSIDPNIKNQHLQSCSLWVDYIYLDTDERRRFAQVSHEYLIEQLQYTGEESINNTANKIRLSFNHPSKELVWVVQKDSHIGTPGSRVSNQWSNYQLDAFDVVGTPFAMYDAPNFGGVGGNFSTTGGASVGATFGNPVVFAKLQLNGHDRFAGREGTYFNLVQLYQHHNSGSLSEGINVYSFGLKPEEHQPSGTVNFSRIDNATLQFAVHPGTFQAIDPETGQISVTTARVRIYAINYNVLRIMSGIDIYLGRLSLILKHFKMRDNPQIHLYPTGDTFFGSGYNRKGKSV